ncbi:hypothetical protein A8926_5546 [Saccharopolyspora spinosa]|uniref:Uncharacterized protein n=1 Tax=Saccharopolyspora spinosa TaxID=60894 RepID=A0A2N3Y3Q8_SACSN|nr:hypothetical protein A8926_5546 [Saccharopolyspora spinosa]
MLHVRFDVVVAQPHAQHHPHPGGLFLLGGQGDEGPQRRVVARPSTTNSAPASTAASTKDVTRSRWAAVTSGPMSQLRRPSPTLSLAIRSAILATSSSPTGSTATTAEMAMHRSPAEPNPADTAASAARSRSASGSTTMWFFSPPSACTRLPLPVPVS